MSIMTSENRTAAPADLPAQRRAPAARDDGGYGTQASAPAHGFVIPVLEPDLPPVVPVISGAPPAVSISHVREVFVSAYEDAPNAFAPSSRAATEQRPAPARPTGPAGPLAPATEPAWYMSGGSAPRFDPGAGSSAARFASGSMGIPHPRAAGGPAWPVAAPGRVRPARGRAALTAVVGLVTVASVAGGSVHYFGLVDVLALLGL